jgi:uroporphyrin-III C-methyltransferase
MKGKAYLVGAGPGDPELLTLKALKILQSADVILHDDLISAEILALAPRTAFIQNVGKRCGPKHITQDEINSRLVSLASSGLQVVRLKGGDPFIFGRGGEEIEALRQHGIAFEIVPGVTAALGAAAATEIPLTQREVSSALVFLTGHRLDENSLDENTDDSWRGFASSGATLVIYMPGPDYEGTALRLLDAGMKGNTPCALISRATSPRQQVYHTTVGELRSAPRLPAPTLLVVGEVTALGAGASLTPAIALRSTQQEYVALVAGKRSIAPHPDARQEQERPA